ncbi:DUF2634 domain-containing protein [Borreliella tanukii]|uniref:contractile injection system sheath initiator n=1 Tax=Borreliella tanukii TaxID=56146 RepID=UPI002648F665|nr:DUF2634 domain-containing protein [Borreliella tanukii]WKC80294.1 DUF2634 domain-containing protein [Borreliella tanukii]WKC81207.1 DUF2634 domain-containing protein [Borreliella tanukii]WKC82122.1 DUF2634 domain-containing protein [Borreliella tanukii]
MEIKIDEKFNIVFNNDLKLIENIEEQKQRLFFYLKTPKGSLQENPNYGFDFNFYFKLCKANKLESIKNFFLNLSKELKIDLINVKPSIKNKTITIKFFFLGKDTLKMDFKI